LVGPVLAGGVLSAGGVVTVIFVGVLSIGEVLLGAELGPLEPPGAGPPPGPVSPGFVPDGLFGSFRNWFGPVGAVPMPAAVAAAIALSAWNEACSIAAMAGGFADSEVVPAGDTENMLLTLFPLTSFPVIPLVR